MIVEVDGITKRFPVRRGWGELLRAPFAAPRRVVVDDVRFAVREGEIFGLLGQNGAGKTTLFKTLATLIVADAGRARIGGHDVATEPAAVRRLVAPVLANERSLYWRLSARENLRLYCALQGLSGAAARAEEMRVLEVTGLASTGTQLVGTFSTGMRQRLLIARALLARPRVLLLDEPTRSLDPISARDFRRFLRETVVGAEGCTVLLATHDADEVFELCDRVGVLDRGRLLAVDATPVLRERAGSDRYVLWVRADSVAALRAMTGATQDVRPVAGADGWQACAVTIAGGADGVAALNAALVAGGHAVARVERVASSLAELIEAVVGAAGRRRDA